MLPTIGLMIGAYIILRSFDIILRAPTQFASKSAQTCMFILALLCVLVTGLGMLGLFLSSSSAGSQLRGIVP